MNSNAAMCCAGVLYAGAVWAFGQGLSQFSPAIGLPDWVTRWFLVATIIGFPFWIAFAWFYEFTPSGLKRESEIDPRDSIAHSSGRKLDFWIIGVLAIAVVLLLTNQFDLHRRVNDVAGAPAAPPNSAPPNSIAVLPFTNESSDKQQDYFADGIAEDLLNLLTEIQPLRVAARTSSFSFRGKDHGIPEIAAKLRVASVLEGSVRKAGDKVRVTVQLVRASDGYQVWSQRYDRRLDDIFAIQDDIAADVVRNLKIKLLGALPTVRETDAKAYALYLQARQLSRQANPDAYKSSNALYRQALAIDPRYAPAWVGLADNFAHETATGMLSNEQGLRQARDATDQALAIDPDYPPAYARLGGLAIDQDDLSAAARYLERALALDPTDLAVLGNSASLLRSLGRLQSAIAVDEYVVARDPVNPMALFHLGHSHFLAGRFDEAIAESRTLLTLNPDIGGARYQLGVTLLLKGDAQAALAQMQQEKSEVWRLIGLPLAYRALGRKADADAAIVAAIAAYEKDAPYNIAYDYAYCGEADQAFAWLDKALAYLDPALSHIPVDPLLDQLHTDPRWLPFLRKAGYAPDQLARIKFTVTLPGAADKTGEATSPAVETSGVTQTSTTTQARTVPTDRL